MKQYNCPDCTHTIDTCENCSRYILNHKTNQTYIINKGHMKFIQFNIPEFCVNCPIHPSNGGSGICFCTSGQQTFC